MPTVFSLANGWADKNFHRLAGGPVDHKHLFAECMRWLNDYPGDLNKKWLFVYSPASDSRLFEVTGSQMRVAALGAKLVTVEAHGGMLVGADFSTNWGTPRCKPEFVPLLVCKPVRAGQSSGTA